MISYLLTSALLSGIGWLFYVIWVKNAGTLWQRKFFIYLTICGSFCIPHFVGVKATVLTAHSSVMTPLEWGEQISPAELLQFCHCKQPDYSHRIRYKANAILNWFILHKDVITWFLMATVVIIGVHLIGQTLFLIYLVRTGNKTSVMAGSDKFILLRHKRLFAIGAFWLFEKYIIWQDLFEPLSPAERSAIYKHELSHLRQRNTLEKIILRVIQCVWFFNPFIYIFRAELEKISEFIADEAGAEMLPNKKTYAHLLLKLQRLKQLPALMDGIGKTLLAKRIQRLIEPHTKQTRPQFGWALLLLILLQFSCASPLLNGVDYSLQELGTYEQIFHKVDQGKEDAVYCTDCETICYPEDDSKSD